MKESDYGFDRFENAVERGTSQRHNFSRVFRWIKRAPVDASRSAIWIENPSGNLRLAHHRREPLRGLRSRTDLPRPSGILDHSPSRPPAPPQTATHSSGPRDDRIHRRRVRQRTLRVDAENHDLQPVRVPEHPICRRRRVAPHRGRDRHRTREADIVVATLASPQRITPPAMQPTSVPTNGTFVGTPRSTQRRRQQIVGRADPAGPTNQSGL